MSRRLLYRLHARQQMAERGIAPADVRAVLSSGRLIGETHIAGRPFPTQVWLGWIGDRAAVDPAGAQYVITVYEPDPEQWNDSLDARKEQ